MGGCGGMWGGGLRPRSRFLEKRQDGEDQEDDETNLGDGCGGTGEATEAEGGGDQSNNEKNDGVVEHGSRGWGGLRESVRKGQWRSGEDSGGGQTAIGEASRGMEPMVPEGARTEFDGTASGDRGSRPGRRAEPVRKSALFRLDLMITDGRMS